MEHFIISKRHFLSSYYSQIIRYCLCLPNRFKRQIKKRINSHNDFEIVSIHQKYLTGFTMENFTISKRNSLDSANNLNKLYYGKPQKQLPCAEWIHGQCNLSSHWQNQQSPQYLDTVTLSLLANIVHTWSKMERMRKTKIKSCFGTLNLQKVNFP